MITSIAFTVYPVLNMERARAFYEHVLGLHVSYDYRDVWVECSVRPTLSCPISDGPGSFTAGQGGYATDSSMLS